MSDWKIMSEKDQKSTQTKKRKKSHLQMSSGLTLHILMVNYVEGKMQSWWKFKQNAYYAVIRLYLLTGKRMQRNRVNESVSIGIGHVQKKPVNILYKAKKWALKWIKFISYFVWIWKCTIEMDWCIKCEFFKVNWCKC